MGHISHSHCKPMRRHYTPDLLRVTPLLGRVTEPPKCELKQSVLGRGRVTKLVSSKGNMELTKVGAEEAHRNPILEK